MKNKILLITIFILSLFVVVSAAKTQSDSFISLYADGSWEYTDGSPTPVVITTTPSASQTPWIVTATPNVIITATPTQEVITPTPSNTPDPLCLLQNQVGGGIRVRNFPSTSGTETLGFIPDGAYIHPESYYQGTTYKWYKVFWDSVIWGWTADFYTYISGDCEGLLYEDPFELYTFMVGLHVTNGNRAQLTEFQYRLNRAGYLSGTANYVQTAYCLDSMNEDDQGWSNLCRMRWPPDCPSHIGTSDPVAEATKYMEQRNGAVQQLKVWAGDNADMLVIELTNECNWEPYEWWVPFFNTVLDYADAHDWPTKLAIPGLGPGYGNYVMFTTWRPFLERNHQRGGFLSMHNYAPVEYCGGDGSLSGGDIYCAFRHRLNYKIIKEIGYDVRILVTEASPTNGYQPIKYETIADIGRYTCMINQDEGLAGIYYWNVGDFAPFADANLGPWLGPLARSIETCGQSLN